LWRNQVDVNRYIARLAAQAEVIAALARGVSDEQARWKPAPKEWSILEVVCHLYDEEREDFRARIRLTLEDPTQDWPPIDPEGWAVSRRYNERDLTSALAGFQVERQASLEWLKSLQSPDWDAAHRHPAGFDLRAGDLLAAWTAHDLLHICQLADLHRLYIAEQARPYSTRYAGE
jgi:hypothetical protein